jgi:hypothetical protein
MRDYTKIIDNHKTNFWGKHSPNEWRECPINDNYAVSIYGEIFSFFRYKKVKQFLSKKHIYPRYTLSKNGVRKTYYVHRLVLMTFNRMPEKGENCNHKDGDKFNNNIWNLEWITQKENCKHALRLGLTPQGEKCKSTIYSDDNIAACLVDILVNNIYKREACAMHGLSEQYVNRVLAGRLRYSIFERPELAHKKPRRTGSLTGQRRPRKKA